MDRRAQIRQGYPIHLRQRDLDGRAFRQCLQVLKNALEQIVVFSAPIPANVPQDNPVVVQCGLLILDGIRSHTF